MIKRGTQVIVSAHYSAPGKGLKYCKFEGVLIDDCNGTGWDVVDIRANDGETISGYSFSVERKQGKDKC